MSEKKSKWNLGNGSTESRKGCSIAFYVVLGLLLLFTLVMYIIYRMS